MRFFPIAATVFGTALWCVFHRLFKSQSPHRSLPWSIGRTVMTMAAALLCQGCQWRMPSHHVQMSLSRIRIERIDEPEGQWLRQRLQQLLGGPCSQPLYTLTLCCRSDIKTWALNKHGQTMWTYIGLNTTYVLKKHPQGHTVASGRLRVSGSLPITTPYYSETISQESMAYRLRERIAQQLYSRLAALMTQHDGRPAPSSQSAPPCPKKPVLPSSQSH